MDAPRTVSLLGRGAHAGASVSRDRRDRPHGAGRRAAARPRGPHRPAGAVVALVLLVTIAGLAARPVAAACWPPPVEGVVVDPFREPGCTWCPGNRGLEYRTARGAPVRSVAAGIVTFAGAVAGTTYVVVRDAGGWLLTYGRLAERSVSAGDPVLGGMVLGRSAGHLFFGLRIDGVHVDPAPHLGRWEGRPRLVPHDGSAPRPAPTPRLRCATSAGRPALAVPARIVGLPVEHATRADVTGGRS